MGVDKFKEIYKIVFASKPIITRVLGLTEAKIYDIV